MFPLNEYFTPPFNASEEWLEGYYAALRRVGAFLTAEADRQFTPPKVITSQPAPMRGFLPASSLWQDTE